MCGIVSLFTKHEHHTDDLKESFTSMNHRGPDDHGIWTSPDKKVSLGHLRLSIIDLKKGKQPLFGSNNRLCAIVNGEFYDYQNIRDRLEFEGIDFKTRSDSEIIFGLYAKYGVHCLEFLRGEFAFIVWDENQKQLFAARDRFGIKPLYFYKDNECLIFASEIKAILSLGIEAEWDEESVFNVTSAYVLDPARTLFKNIYQIPPGHFVVASDAQFSIRKYWDLNYNQQDVNINEAEVLRSFREQLEEAVKLRLIADVPVGLYLSGGLDSCSLLALASAFTDQKIDTFSLSFNDNDKDYDERAIAEEMSRHVGAVFNPITITEKDLADNFSGAIYNSEFVFVNGHGIAKFLLSKTVRDAGYKVVLTGEGSDELLAGYPHFRQDLIYNSGHSQTEIKKLLDQLMDSNKVSSGMLMTDEKLNITELNNIFGFVPSFYQNSVRNYEKIKDFLNEGFRATFKNYNPYFTLINLIDGPPIHSADAVHKAMYAWTKTVFPNYLLNVLGDRMEMAHSVEARVAFLDHKFVEFVQSIPTSLKIKNMTEKYLLREALKDLLPEKIYRRQKHPFLSPPALSKPNGELFKFYADVIHSKDFERLHFINHASVRQLFDKLPSLSEEIRQSIDPILTMFVSLSELSKIFKI